MMIEERERDFPDLDTVGNQEGKGADIPHSDRAGACIASAVMIIVAFCMQASCGR